MHAATMPCMQYIRELDTKYEMMTVYPSNAQIWIWGQIKLEPGLFLDDYAGPRDGVGGSFSQEAERKMLVVDLPVGKEEEGGNPSGKLSRWNQCTFQCALCNKTSNRCLEKVTPCFIFNLHFLAGPQLSLTLWRSMEQLSGNIAPNILILRFTLSGFSAGRPALYDTN